MLRFLDRAWLLTCHHVVSSALHIWVSLSRQGLSNAQPAQLVAACPLLDLALLEFVDPLQAESVASLPPWTAHSAENALAGPKAGAAALVVGFPLGQTHLKMTRGIINGQQNGFLQTDAPINPGNSGGPLMCQRQVVGISAQGAFMASSAGWAIPISYALNFLRHVAELLGDRGAEEDNDGLDGTSTARVDPVHKNKL
jgi:serine protease Do